MCDFFSLVSDGAGNVMYFDATIRKQIINRALFDSKRNKITKTDSHSSILAYHGIYGKYEDMYNKYEYNPLTKELKIDTLNNKNDSEIVKEFCLNLDFKTIISELIVKPIVNPKNIVRDEEVTELEIELFKKWIDINNSSVCSSVCSSVWSSVRDSVSDSVWSSVRGSVCSSVWSSVWDSMWDSVLDSVSGYISSFFTLENWKYFDHEPYINPFQSAIDLWERGLVASFDGTTWRLHLMCDDAKVVYEIKGEWNNMAITFDV